MRIRKIIARLFFGFWGSSDFRADEMLESFCFCFVGRSGCVVAGVFETRTKRFSKHCRLRLFWWRSPGKIQGWWNYTLIRSIFKGTVYPNKIVPRCGLPQVDHRKSDRKVNQITMKYNLMRLRCGLPLLHYQLMLLRCGLPFCTNSWWI